MPTILKAFVTHGSVRKLSVNILEHTRTRAQISCIVVVLPSSRTSAHGHKKKRRPVIVALFGDFLLSDQRENSIIRRTSGKSEVEDEGGPDRDVVAAGFFSTVRAQVCCAVLCGSNKVSLSPDSGGMFFRGTVLRCW